MPGVGWGGVHGGRRSGVSPSLLILAVVRRAPSELPLWTLKVKGARGQGLI